MGDLSKHFSKKEFADKRTGELGDISHRLLLVLEHIRGAHGGPVRIVSGWRSKETNRQVGGATRSRHLVGEAADIPPGVCSLAEAVEAGATGIGLSGEWVTHVDVRSPWGTKPTVWHY